MARRADVGSWEHGDLLKLTGIKRRLPAAGSPERSQGVVSMGKGLSGARPKVVGSN
jgi:hypothetical protein